MTRRQALARAYVDALYLNLRKHFPKFAAPWLDRQYAARITERVLDDMLVAYGRSEARPPS